MADGITEAQYEMLKDTVNNLNKKSLELDDPITDFETTAKQIGEDGAAWAGTAAMMATPELNKVKQDIIVLQSYCKKLSDIIGETSEHFMEQDAKATKAMQDIKGA